MATTVHSPKVGMLVYRIRQPQAPGKVLGVREDQHVHVLWLSGEESWINTAMLRDLDALIAEQSKVIEGHKARRGLLAKL